MGELFLFSLVDDGTDPFCATLSYISRANPRDNTRHVVLSTTSVRPADFAAQLNVSLANGWGIVRTIIDMCMKMPEGKYVLVKDPNKVSLYPDLLNITRAHRQTQPVIRLYSVPADTFVGQDEEEEEEVEEEEA